MPDLTVFAPYDLKTIETLPLQSEQAVLEMVDRAKHLKEPLPLDERIALLRRVEKMVEERAFELAKCAAHEGGKPLVDSEVEVKRGIEGIRSAIQTLETETGHMIPMGTTPMTKGRLAFTLREPLGPLFAISAFNHPFNLIIHQVIPAVAAGCPVLIKPALKTPLSCRKLVDILYEAGLPKGFCQLVICADEVTAKIAQDARLSCVSFIGSAKVGWHLRRHLAPGVLCLLEHGGAAPVVVLEDADTDRLIPPLIKGGFYHAGQVCVSVQRVYIPKNRLDEVAKKMTEAISKLVVGDPLNGNTQVGPLIAPENIHKIDQLVKEGGQVLCGGAPISNTCYSPTLLLDPPDTCRVSQEEIFGPVVCLYPYETCDEAITRANALPFSFQAALFGKALDPLLSSAKKLKGCAVMINDHTAFRADWMPFGGRETSGLGMGGIPYSIRQLLVEKLLVIQSPSL